MDSFLAGTDRTHPQPKRNMKKYCTIPFGLGRQGLWFFDLAEGTRRANPAAPHYTWGMVLQPTKLAANIVNFMKPNKCYDDWGNTLHMYQYIFGYPPQQKITSMESLMAFTSHYWLLTIVTGSCLFTPNYIVYCNIKKNQNVFSLLGDCG